MKNKLIVGMVVLGLALSGVAQTKIESSIVPRWSGAEVGEWTMDYEAAFAAAATNENCRGVIMYFVGLWWCPYCRALEAKGLSQQVWSDYALSNNFYLVAMDYPSRTGGNWCWLWEPDYVTNKTSMTMEQAAQEVIDRYQVQTKYAVPGATYNTTFGYYQIGYPTMVVFRPGDSEKPLGRTSFPDFNGGAYDTTNTTAAVALQIEQILQADPEDEADNYWQGATPLDVSEECEDDLVDYGCRTLSPRDTADWYKFESPRNRIWTFEVSPGDCGATNNVSIAIYTDPTKSAALSQTVYLANGISTNISYTTPSSGTYYVRMSRPSGSASVVQGYHLSYGYSVIPANISFEKTAVSVANTAGSVTLKVNITKAELAEEVKVDYETEDITAVAGTDYVGTTGTLTWAAGEPKVAKTITVPTLTPTAWSAAKTFKVSLSAERHCSIEELSTCTVTLTTTPRKPGKLAFAAGTPKAVTLAEGTNMTFQVTRQGGADGVVTGRVDVVQGGTATALATLVWASSDDAPQTFDFGFPAEAGYQPDRTVTLRLAASGGATLGSPSSVNVTRRDGLVSQSLADYSAANKAWGLKATGAWFYGHLEGGTEEWLRTDPLSGNATAELSGTWTGPGALVFTCQREVGAEMTLLVNGSAVTNDFTDGVESWVALPSGKQTVAWRVTGPADAVGAVAISGFTPLAQATPLSPLNQAFVAADAREGFFAWGGVATPSIVTPRYLICAGTKATALVPQSGLSGAFEETAFPRTGIVADMDWLTGLLTGAMDKTLYWRVDTVITDDYGRDAVVSGKVSSVNILDVNAPTVDVSALPPDCAVDITDGATVDLPQLVVGVQSRVGPFALANVATGATVSVTAKNGKLPGGVKAQVSDGAVWLAGVPKAAGTGAADLVLSVKQTVGKKTVTVRGTSMRVGWTVLPLGRIAGQYNGFRMMAADIEPGYGDIQMTVSAAGKVSGKFRYEGTSYAFSAPNFDGIDASGQFIVTNAVAKAGTAVLNVSLTASTAQTPEAVLALNGITDSEYMLYRNNWKDAAPMGTDDALANYTGYYTAALPVETLGSAAAPAGTGYLTLTAKPNGTVTYASVLADGKSASGSAILLYGSDCCSSTDRLMFYLLAVPRGYGAGSGLFGVIHFVPDVTHNVTEVTLSPTHTFVKWVNTNPKSVYGYNATTGTSSEGTLGFTNVLSVVGGYYAKNTSLVQHYGAGAVLNFEPLFGAPLDLDGAQGASGFTLLSLPVTNMPMTVAAAAKLSAPAPVLVKNAGLVDCEASTNAWGMSWTFKPATGLFTATFKAYYQNGAATAQKTKTLSAKGVFVPRRASYDDTADWLGFYLVPDKYQYPNAQNKPVTYPFNWSYDLRLGVPAP